VRLRDIVLERVVKSCGDGGIIRQPTSEPFATSKGLGLILPTRRC